MIDLEPAPALTPAAKLQLALEMADLGIEMKRRSMRRRDPDASEDEIDRRLRAWLAASR